MWEDVWIASRTHAQAAGGTSSRAGDTGSDPSTRLYVVEEHERGEGGKGGVVQHARQDHILEVSHPAG